MVFGKTKDACAEGSEADIHQSRLLRPEGRDQEESAVRRARGVSVVSVIVSVIVGLIAASIGVAEGAVSLCGFGGEALLDAVSSLLVFWRYKTPKARQFADDDEVARRKRWRDSWRERNSSVGIAVTFIVLAVLLITMAIVKLTTWDPNDPDHLSEEHAAAVASTALAWPSCLIFLVLGLVKLWLNRILHSQVLMKDAFCSLLGSFLGLVVGVTGAIELSLEEDDDPKALAAIDPSAAIIIAVILLLEGLRTVWHNRPSQWPEEKPVVPPA